MDLLCLYFIELFFFSSVLVLEISDEYTHSYKPMIGDKSTGIITIKSDKINACT